MALQLTSQAARDTHNNNTHPRSSGARASLRGGPGSTLRAPAAPRRPRARSDTRAQPRSGAPPGAPLASTGKRERPASRPQLHRRRRPQRAKARRRLRRCAAMEGGRAAPHTSRHARPSLLQGASRSEARHQGAGWPLRAGCPPRAHEPSPLRALPRCQGPCARAFSPAARPCHIRGSTCGTWLSGAARLAAAAPHGRADNDRDPQTALGGPCAAAIDTIAYTEGTEAVGAPQEAVGGPELGQLRGFCPAQASPRPGP